MTTDQKAKFTPGPWVASFNTHYFQIDAKDGRQIGDACTSQYIDGTYDVPNLALARANARLMAAAPELLSTLTRVLNALALDGAGMSLDTAVQEARALISRVEGQL